jgi:hypothetical protein
VPLPALENFAPVRPVVGSCSLSVGLSDGPSAVWTLAGGLAHDDTTTWLTVWASWSCIVNVNVVVFEAGS